MRKPLFLALVIWLGWAGVAFSETLEVSSQISEVTVFPGQATVVRRASLKLPKGPQTLRLSALPGIIEPNSVSAKGSGERPVKLFGAELATTQLALPQDPKVREIEEKLKELYRWQKSLQDNKEILSQEREYLVSIRAASSDQVGKDIITKQPSVEEISGILAFLDKAFTANFTREQEADKGLQELQEEIDRLNRELEQLTHSRVKRETAILVEVEAQEAGRFDLEVSYRTTGANWSPSYEARTDSNSQKVNFATYGVIRQQTGEDWENVKLTLSTARPSVGGRMPELPSWVLRKQEVIALGGVAAKRGRVAMEQQVMSATAPQAVGDERDQFNEEKAEEVYAQSQTQGPAVTYLLPKSMTVRSDGQLHKVPVTSDLFSADVAYETTPKLVQQAFLRAKVKNTTDSLYLAGPVQVFLDGAFVATSQLKQTAPQEEFDLFLGVDERIKVERKKLKDKVDISFLPGLQGRMKATDQTYWTKIENYTPRRVKIILTDQIPVSQFDDIKVESVVMEPASSEEDKERPGIRRWTFELEPGAKQEVTLSFRIRHPVDLPVEGL